MASQTPTAMWARSLMQNQSAYTRRSPGLGRDGGSNSAPRGIPGCLAPVARLHLATLPGLPKNTRDQRNADRATNRDVLAGKLSPRNVPVFLNPENIHTKIRPDLKRGGF